MSPYRFALFSAAVLAAVALWGSAIAAGRGGVDDTLQSPRPLEITHVVVIAFENHNFAQVMGRHAPRSYFKQLGARCGSAANFTAAHVPRSLPNYLAVTSGRVTVTTDCQPGPGCQTSAHNIFGQLGAKRWRVWEESMPGRCVRKNTGLYVPRHAAPPYYTRISNAVCRANVLPLPKTPPRIHRAFTWIVPNLQHDFHDGTPRSGLGVAARLHGRPARPAALERLPGGSHGGVHLVRHGQQQRPAEDADPADRRARRTCAVACITQHLSNYQLLRSWQGMLHLNCTNRSCGARGLMGAFHL